MKDKGSYLSSVAANTSFARAEKELAKKIDFLANAIEDLSNALKADEKGSSGEKSSWLKMK